MPIADHRVRRRQLVFSRREQGRAQSDGACDPRRARAVRSVQLQLQGDRRRFARRGCRQARARRGRAYVRPSSSSSPIATRGASSECARSASSTCGPRRDIAQLRVARELMVAARGLELLPQNAATLGPRMPGTLSDFGRSMDKKHVIDRRHRLRLGSAVPDRRPVRHRGGVADDAHGRAAEEDRGAPRECR